MSDPIPSGATILGSGLGRDSAILNSAPVVKGSENEKQEWDSCWGPAYTENTFEGVRAYYDYFPKGKCTFEYTVRLNGGGKFALPNTRVESMYSPELFGEAPNAAVDIKD